MVIGKIKPSATLVAQFAAGVEVEAIQHDGKMFLPVVSLGEFGATEVPSDSPAQEPKPDKKPAPAAPAETSDVKTYTKDELMDMEPKELIKILKNDYSIDPDDYDGKNTNKKLRDLILKAQEENGGDDAENDDEKPAPKRGKDAPKEDEGGDDLTDKVAGLLEEFDDGTRNKKKTIEAICNLVDDADKDAITELIDNFEEDGDASIDDTAEEIANALSGEKKKPAPKKHGEKSKKEELVEADDLEVGDRVSVYWNDENKEWYDGEVDSIKKGKVHVAYDDGSDDFIDPKIHTKIKRLAK